MLFGINHVCTSLPLQYRTTHNYRDAAFLGPRIGDKLLIGLLIMTLYLGIGDDFAPDNVINIAAVNFMFVTMPAFGAAAYVPAIVLGEWDHCPAVATDSLSSFTVHANCAVRWYSNKQPPQHLLQAIICQKFCDVRVGVAHVSSLHASARTEAVHAVVVHLLLRVNFFKWSFPAACQSVPCPQFLLLQSATCSVVSVMTACIVLSHT